MGFKSTARTKSYRDFDSRTFVSGGGADSGFTGGVPDNARVGVQQIELEYLLVAGGGGSSDDGSGGGGGGGFLTGTYTITTGVGYDVSVGVGGSYAINGQSSGGTLGINTSFGTVSNPGTATTVGVALVQLGQSFVEGVAQPEVKKYSGEVLYIDNRAAIQRSASQKEDIKIVLEF